MKYMASCSSGKDSVAMVEMIIESELPLDEIVFAKLEKEFPQEEKFRNMLIERWQDKGYKCTVLQTDDTWDNWFYGENTRGERKGLKRGMPLTLFACWWSREAKFKILDNYMKNSKRYIGIAFDEPNRYHPETGYLYPLIENFRMTESDCWFLCSDKGLLNPLYKHFSRLGCYLCPKQSKESLINLCRYYPKQWKELVGYVKSTMDNSFVSQGVFNSNIDIYELLTIEKEVKYGHEQTSF